MYSHEKGMNPVAKSIINPRKEYWPSPTIESATCSQVLYAINRAMWLGRRNTQLGYAGLNSTTFMYKLTLYHTMTTFDAL